MTHSTAVERRVLTLPDLLANAVPKMRAVLPPSTSLLPEKIIRLALMDVQNSAALKSCDANSIVTSVIHAAALGLQVGPFLGEAYLVPFKGKCTLIPGYKGLAKLAMQGLSIANIDARLVYRDDVFKVEYGTSPRIIHEPDLEGSRDDDDIIAAYMVADLRNGRQKFEVMTRAEILKRRDASKAKNDGPWVQWFPEQVKKTAVRYGVKLLPASTDTDAFERLNAAVELDNRYDNGHITAPNQILDDEDALRRDMTERTQEQATGLREKLKSAKATAKVATAELTDEENLELDKKLAAEDEGHDS